MNELIPDPTPVLTHHWLFEPVSVSMTTVTASEPRPDLWLALLIIAVLGLVVVMVAWYVFADGDAYRAGYQRGYERGYDAAERAHGVDVRNER